MHSLKNYLCMLFLAVIPVQAMDQNSRGIMATAGAGMLGLSAVSAYHSAMNYNLYATTDWTPNRTAGLLNGATCAAIAVTAGTAGILLCAKVQEGKSFEEIQKYYNPFAANFLFTLGLGCLVEGFSSNASGNVKVISAAVSFIATSYLIKNFLKIKKHFKKNY